MGCFRPVSPDHFGPLLGYCDHQIMKQMVRRLRQYDVSPIQCRVLIYLEKQQKDVPQKELQQFLMVKPSTVNGVVERLEEKGLVTRSISPADARCRMVHLTEQGRSLYQEFLRVESEVHRQAEQGFSPEEIETLRAYLLRVAANLTDETKEEQLHEA